MKRSLLPIGFYVDDYENSIDLINSILSIFSVEMKPSTISMMYSEDIDFAILYLLRTYYNKHNYNDICIEFILGVVEYMQKSTEDINYFMSLIHFLGGNFNDESFLIKVSKLCADSNINILSRLYEYTTYSGSTITFDRERIIDILRSEGVTFYKNKSSIKKLKSSPYEIIPKHMKGAKTTKYSIYNVPYDSNPIFSHNFNVKSWNFISFVDHIIESIAEYFKFSCRDAIKIGRILGSIDNDEDNNIVPFQPPSPQFGLNLQFQQSIPINLFQKHVSSPVCNSKNEKYSNISKIILSYLK